jgi:hypothetical protein
MKVLRNLSAVFVKLPIFGKPITDLELPIIVGNW